MKRLKGEGRPVQDESARAEVLAALEAVDLVAVFEEDTPIDLITKVRPSVLVKGGDYTREQVVGHEIVEAAGGEVVLVDILPGHSTTSLVDRARGRQGVKSERCGSTDVAGAAVLARPGAVDDDCGRLCNSGRARAALVDVAGGDLRACAGSAPWRG